MSVSTRLFWRYAPILALVFGAPALVSAAQPDADPSQHSQIEAQATASCAEDIMIVFDASASMSIKDIDGVATRMSEVREALSKVLPEVAPVRDLGLMIYGPGPKNRCENIQLKLRPSRYTSERILNIVDGLSPGGWTPLTAAVSKAANILGARMRPGVIVVVTDGEETCGGSPCDLAKSFRTSFPELMVHVIGHEMDRPANVNKPSQAHCLAEETGGRYIATATSDDLVDALHDTIGCPLVTDAAKRRSYAARRSGTSQNPGKY